ncbi:hypothetical protein N7474_007466 [Penicillium riverlandense]|uniref:uncharacterized protein n=1 Tax=Penicillium riverlandense TaxID=1903569 RepID=UPI0025468A33|nr:uncharacterized protein N7474_007466 [Penicillium riverlandense]KAJ5815689.1 hypothetical protein N7474_007466 [Penicillium riverlandense]
MISLIYTQCSNARPSALCDLLRKYGVGRVLECDSTSTPEIPSGDEEIILVNYDHEFSTAAIRQVTFRTARLPKAFVIWDSPRQQQVVAMRVPHATFQNSLIENKDLSSTVRALATQKDLVSTTYGEFCSNSACAVGGSFSDSGVRQYFAKVAKDRGVQKLRDEIRMYQSLPEDLQDHYPQLIFTSEEDGTVTMGTNFQDFPNLRDLLLNNHISTAEAARIMTKVLDFEYNQAFLQYQQPTPENYLYDYHFLRAWRRLTMSAEIDPIFGPIVAAPSLKINGQQIPSVPAMLWRLEQDQEAARRLDPGGVSPYIHADFHPGNIICDIKQDQFWLVDPRGYPLCDIFYDLGKLAQSTNSCYDLLHEGRHEVSYEAKGDTATINYKFLVPSFRAQYADLNARLQPVIHKLLEADKGDVDLRIRFNEAMHLCSLMPFHIHPDAQPSLAVPIFAIGAMRLSEVMGLLGISMDECAANHAGGLERLKEMGQAAWRFEG